MCTWATFPLCLFLVRELRPQAADGALPQGERGRAVGRRRQHRARAEGARGGALHQRGQAVQGGSLCHGMFRIRLVFYVYSR